MNSKTLQFIFILSFDIYRESRLWQANAGDMERPRIEPEPSRGT